MTDPTAHGPIPVALALLDQQWPPVSAMQDGTTGEGLARLKTDPRYLLGRLQQAMTVLLATDLPAMDPQTALLSQALQDALDWRTHRDRPCDQCNQCGDELCGQCSADWDQADRYHELARALGAVGDLPSARPAAACGESAA
jgi:hypothetical protein